MVTVTCKQCLNTYLVHPYRLAKTKYCSPKCNGDGNAAALSRRRILQARKKRLQLAQPQDYRLIALAEGAAKVSVADYEYLSEFFWSATKRGYAHCGGKATQRMIMHRVVVERMTGRKIASSDHVDHINHDTLDNRRSNLRVTTAQQNTFNSLPSNGTSKYKGVSWHRQISKWVGTIHIDRKKIHIGCFEQEDDAAIAYDAAAIQLYGDYAWLNIIGR